MRVCAVLAALLVGADEKPEKSGIVEVPLTGLGITVPPPDRGKATESAVVTSPADLRRVPPFGPAAVEALEKRVDFLKDKLLVFWWAGSGQDALTAGQLKVARDGSAGKKGPARSVTATFLYTPGKTRDRRGHLRLFVVPAEAEVKVEAGK